MEEKIFYVYLHIKKDTGEPFYVGKGKNNRAFSKQNRNKHWNNIVNKYGFDIILLEENLTDKDALTKEVYWIKRIGRKDLKQGPLVNFTDGGEGSSNPSEETRKKMSFNARNRSKETREKLSKASKGRQVWLGKSHNKNTKLIMSDNNIKNRLVLNIDTGIYYKNITEASKAYNYNISTLKAWLYGYLKNKSNLILV